MQKNGFLFGIQKPIIIILKIIELMGSRIGLEAKNVDGLINLRKEIDEHEQISFGHITFCNRKQVRPA